MKFIHFWRLLCLVFMQIVWLGASQAAVRPLENEEERSVRSLLRQEAQGYENGEGVERDPAKAAELYCKAARLGDAEAQFNLGWMYANGRGVERSDANAAFFFHAAAEQGLDQAVRMLATVGGPPNYVPECMVDRTPPQMTAPPARTAAAPPPVEVIPPDAPRHIVEIVKRHAPQYRLSPALVLAFIKVESNYDTIALSPKNAKGLMQLIPETAARFGVARPYDAEQNIRGGMAYLRWLMAYFEGNVPLVAAAYNAGEGAVNRYRGVPPYAETRAYVARILGGYGRVSHPFDASVTSASPQLPLMRSSLLR
ncbi:transglycosylase SLT domain-containing protein [Piscinibacter sp.]|uniref:transglycosylase SLT domain-containing protein n=1 Tax=Piscinibacter sp. TaxID=1903157 RepID=UPI0039E3B609